MIPGLGGYNPYHPGAPTPSPVPEEFAGIGRSEQPVYGSRAFRTDAETGMLTGITFAQVWEIGMNDARCWKAEPSMNYSQAYYDCKEEEHLPNTVPHSLAKCTHGFYAYYDTSHDFRNPSKVEAIVKGQGETLIGRAGFRCVNAEILGLVIPEIFDEDLADQIRMNYWSIPLFRTFEEMVLEFPVDKPELILPEEA